MQMSICNYKNLEKNNCFIYFSLTLRLSGWTRESNRLKNPFYPIFETAAWFFVFILKFIFTSIFEIKIHEKNSLTPEKISFSKADFQ